MAQRKKAKKKSRSKAKKKTRPSPPPVEQEVELSEADSEDEEGSESRVLIPDIVFDDDEFSESDSDDELVKNVSRFEEQESEDEDEDRPPLKKASMGKKSKRRSTEEVLEDTGKALAPTDPVSQYLAEIRKYPLLDREEERRIAEHYYETGDQKSAEILVTSNLRFVVKIAAEYAKFGAKLIDLIQEGNIGLMQGVREFNPYKGVRLISYAVWWIRGYIQEYLMRQYSLVRIGTTHNQRKLFYQLQKERDELERMGVEAGIKQLSGRLGISEGEIRSMNQRLTGRDVSLSVPTGTDQSNSTLLDMQADESLSDVDSFIGQNEEINILRNSIKDLRPELNPREIEILDKRILADDPLTLQEIGDLNNTTREAVRQMEARLLKKIKRAVAQQNLIETED